LVVLVLIVRRVVITGLGAVTPLGNDVPSTWAALLEGRSGIAPIEAFDASTFPVQIAGEVRGYDPASATSPKEARKFDRNVLFALTAAKEAIADAGPWDHAPDRIGVVVGNCIGGFNELMRQYDVLRERGPDRVSPTFLANVLVDSPSGQLAIELGMTGPNYAIVSACATGSHAIGEAAEIVRRGDADVVLAGGTESCVHPLILAGFCSMRALAAQNGDPRTAARPFDAQRSGFVIAEGAGLLVLEDFDAARARGARLYAEVVGYGASNDAHHMLQPEPEALGVAHMMRAALDRAGVAPERVGYVNAHGTGTPLGDVAETKAIKDVFGAHAYELAVSSTKSMTGHMFGAAGACEGIFTALALYHRMLPPTINYETQDPDCDLDYVPNVARACEVDVAISNAMGLGGHNGCVLLARVA
jgi:3-oxoacyl-[acyl-carrier-protein] synthase II